MNDEERKRIESLVLTLTNAREKMTNSSKFYGHFKNANPIAFMDGELSSLQKELIALGISIKIHCETCMIHHIESALKLGATERHVIETIDVAIAMGGGPAAASGGFALQVFEYFKGKEKDKEIKKE